MRDIKTLHFPCNNASMQVLGRYSRFPPCANNLSRVEKSCCKKLSADLLWTTNLLMLCDNLRVSTSRIPPPSRISEKDYARIRRRVKVLSVISSFIRKLMINYKYLACQSAQHNIFLRNLFPRRSIGLSLAVPTRHGEKWTNQEWTTITISGT